MRQLSFFLGMIGVLAAVNALAQSTPAPSVEPMIVGGKQVPTISDAHWQVALVQGKDTTLFQFCGGSLVAPGWVLTAAHCVDNPMVAKDPKRLDVIAGTLAYNSGGVRVSVDRIIVHPKWHQTDKEYDFDASLLQLKSPITLVEPIKLIAPTGTLGPNVQVSGWGAITEGGPVSKVLLRADIPVISNDDCNKPESYDGRVSAQMFCAGVRAGGLDSCQGDSGGPAVSKNDTGTLELAGIVSWGFGCARRLQPGVYTRVTTVSQWASDTIAGH